MLSRLIHALTALAGGAAGAQVPALYARYTHEVGARIRQASEGLDAITGYAERQGIAVHEALNRLRAKGGVAEAAYRDLHETYTTLERLEPAYTALTNAGPLVRPVVFVRHFDPTIAEAALADFSPALPLSATGAAYAAVGAVAVLLATRGGHMLCTRAARGLRRARTKITSTHGTDHA
ncbi:Protein of unknown function [Limimonas halophila]|uniref:DUF2937 family protein n=1 Tax=Limimonas halophila TaxID=1082479 RepID=A0A1G7MD06_9PROT|nr:DUF2937 family protein [Limimonas halophila]SDF59708.1 Protein of unknown function [Limimonas halophila]